MRMMVMMMLVFIVLLKMMMPMLMLYFASRHSATCLSAASIPRPPNAKMQIGHIAAAAAVQFFAKNVEMIKVPFLCN